MKDWKVIHKLPESAQSATDVVRFLLERRGVRTDDEVKEFLNPKLQNLSDPLRLPDMKEAVERVERGLRNGERLLIYSDYDVDGMTSSALLYRFLKKIGYEKVNVFLPDRLNEGYGLTESGIKRALDGEKPDLLMALDCGTTSVDVVKELVGMGVDVVVIDHHEIAEELPPAIALVNPQRTEGVEEDLVLATVGLVFKFCHALLKLRGDTESVDLKEFLDLVALGTVADVVPLQGDNRIFVKQGLVRMNQTLHVGIKELLERAGMKRSPTPSTCGYVLGPRLNACGRIGCADLGWELLVTDDRKKGRKIAEQLEGLNEERRRIEKKVLADVEGWLEENFKREENHCIVVGSRGWHPGVIGIVASRLLKQYYLPSVVISIGENGLGKGSARNIENCSIMDALRECGGCLEGFGGHAMAAGIEIKEERIEEFRKALDRWYREHCEEKLFRPSLKIDIELNSNMLSPQLAFELEGLQPFGRENLQPVFMVQDVEIIGKPKPFGGKNIRFKGRFGGWELNVVGFGFEDQMPSERPSLAGFWEVDDYTGSPCFRMIDWR